MFLSDDLINKIIEQIQSQANLEKNFSAQNLMAGLKDTKNARNTPAINPTRALVILGLLGGVLDISSILVTRDQLIQIRLDGSLKRKTKLDKMLDEIGAMPFEDVMRAMLDKLTS